MVARRKTLTTSTSNRKKIQERHGVIGELIENAAFTRSSGRNFEQQDGNHTDPPPPCTCMFSDPSSRFYLSHGVTEIYKEASCPASQNLDITLLTIATTSTLAPCTVTIQTSQHLITTLVDLEQSSVNKVSQQIYQLTITFNILRALPPDIRFQNLAQADTNDSGNQHRTQPRQDVPSPV